MSGFTASTSGIVTTGAYQTTNAGSNDAFLAMFGTAPIFGPTTVCSESTITLSDISTGGTWVSSSTTNATVGSSSGIVTGVTAGSVVISYSAGGSIQTTTITVSPAPIITSVSPLAGYPASGVAITGSNFNTTPSNNIVYFGATKAGVSTATATSLNVTVPTDATYMPVTVLNNSCPLIAESQYPFLPTYNNSAYSPGSIHFDGAVSFASPSDGYPIFADIDGDGKADMVVITRGTTTNAVSIFRNTSTTGSISPSSFTTQVDFAAFAGISGMAVADIDGDGKLDIIISYGSASGGVAISLFLQYGFTRFYDNKLSLRQGRF